MDASQNKNLVLCFALALLLAAPFSAVAQSVTPSSTTVGFSNCTVAPTVLNVVSTITDPVNYNASVSYPPGSILGNWLAVNVDGASDPGGQSGSGTAPGSGSATPSKLTIQVNLVPNTIVPVNATVVLTPAGAGAQVQITVTFTPGQTCGGGGGGSNGFVSVSPTSVTLPVGTPMSNLSVSSQATLTNLTGSDITFTLAAPNNGWLSAQYNITNVIGAHGTTTISILGTPSTLAAGTVTDSVTITPSVGVALTVLVTFPVGTGSGSNGTVSVSPSPLTLPTAAAFGANQVAATLNLQNLTASAVTYSVGVTSNGGWLSFLINSGTNSIAANGTSTITVYGNPSTLASGNYSGTITITGAGSADIPVQVNMSVGTGGGGFGTLILNGTGAVASANFAYTTGGSVPSPEGVTIATTNTNGATYSGTIQNETGGVNWLLVNFQPDQFSGFPLPGTVDLRLQESVAVGLGAGTYSATVALSSSDGSTATINVTYVVNSGTAAGVTVSPSTTFAFPAVALGTGVSESQQFTVTAAAGTSLGSPNISSQSNPGNWLSISTQSATSSQVLFTATAATAGLAAGSYSGNITIPSDGPGGAGQTVVVVTLVVNASSGPLTLTASSLTFSAVTNGSIPAAQTLGVSTSPTGTLFTAASSEQSCTATNWLTISPFGNNLQTNSNITVTVNQAGLPVGTCTGRISLTKNGQSQVQIVSVTMNVINAGSTVTANPTSLTFSAPGGTVPTQQVVAVTSTSGSAGVFCNITTGVTGGAANWLQTTLTSGTTPFNFGVNVNPAGLAASATPYSGTVTITPVGGGASFSVPVSLTVTGAPTVAASPASLSFSYQLGGTSPTGTIQVTGGSGLTFSAAASSTGSWLAVSPTSGTTPATLNVTVNPSGLNAGQTYNGTVTVSGTGTATGSTIISVSLQVTAPLPTISTVINGASGFTGGFSPGEVISLFAPKDGSHPIGPAVGVQLQASDIVNGHVPTTLGGVQVAFYPTGDLAPILYASATQVNVAIPYGIAGFANPQVLVRYLGQTSNAFVLQAAASAPGIATANGSGTGPGAILNYDAAGNVTFNSPSNPVTKGNYIALFVTGEGLTDAARANPAANTGKVTVASPTPPFTPQPLLPVGVTIDGVPVTPAFWGEAPGLISGVMQVNVQIPANARTGDLPIIVSVGGNGSQNGVTVSVK